MVMLQLPKLKTRSILKFLQLRQLVPPHTAIWLAPAVIGLLADKSVSGNGPLQWGAPREVARLFMIGIGYSLVGFLQHRPRNRPLPIHDLRLREIIAGSHVERSGGNLKTVHVAVFALRLETEGEGAVLIAGGGRVVEVITVVVVGMQTTGG